MIKLQIPIGIISVPPFQKQSFADVLQSRCSFEYYEILQLFFIEHIWWLLLPFASTFRNSYRDDLSVILFTLTHPSNRLNTCLRLTTKKVDQGVKFI